MIGIERREAMLEARLAELGRRLNGIETELESHAARGWDDLATEREGDEVLEELGLSGQQEIRMINAALARIAGGTYGDCGRCGGPISAARLDVLPWAPLCRTCAQQAGDGRDVR